MDIYETVTSKIVAMIEAGAGEWRMPWHADPGKARDGILMPVNLASGKPYRGINVPLLWATADTFGYSSPVWATYKQWAEKGAQVRKGEKSSMIVFWKQVASRSDDDDSEPERKHGHHMMARGYFVFNAGQVDGYDGKLPVKVALPAELPEGQRIAAADAFFGRVGAIVRHGGNRAFYSPAGDFIAMPEFRQFLDAHGYYATLAHEHCHWTGAKTRCDRIEAFGKRFGDEAYAFEELVAELGAAFWCASSGLSNEPRPDHAAYLASWLRTLNHDKRAIFTAASKAQAAVDYLQAAASAATEQREAA